jgi:hypothetical protein
VNHVSYVFLTSGKIGAMTISEAKHDSSDVGPTPERLKRAEGQVSVGTDHVFRVESSPLARLRSRNVLCRDDKLLNDILAAAGEKYERSWCATHPSLPSFGIPLNTRVDAQPRTDVECSIDRVARFQKARSVLDAVPEWRIVVDRIVLFGETPAIVGCDVSGLVSEKQGLAVALDRLRLGLQRLAIHYQLVDARVFRPPNT